MCTLQSRLPEDYSIFIHYLMLMFVSKAVKLHYPLVCTVMPSNFKRAFSEHVLTCSAIYCRTAAVPQAKSVVRLTCF